MVRKWKKQEDALRRVKKNKMSYMYELKNIERFCLTRAVRS